MTAWVAESVLQTMRNEAHRRFPVESGGVLIGYWAKQQVIIVAATAPGPDAHHTSARYVPDQAHDEQQVAQAYNASRRRYIYLGDWHTHPNQDPYLSEDDCRTLAHIAAHGPARATVPIMIVLGGGPSDWYAKVWRYRHGRSRPMRLRLYEKAGEPW
ncbi:MAG: Mov34/MPN/PAD-1 family protein [Acidobacteriales bacterium]|nr:Mov34/MPN/PAD-1 family protein [Terriglobales bacterium]